MLPATYNFSVVRGTSGPTQGLKFRLKERDSNGDLVNVTFTSVRLSIYKRTDLLLRLTTADPADETFTVTDPLEAEVTWSPTPQETRLIPQGSAKAQYELEIWKADGSQIVMMMGSISGIGGLNDDDAEDAS